MSKFEVAATILIPTITLTVLYFIDKNFENLFIYLDSIGIKSIIAGVFIVIFLAVHFYDKLQFTRNLKYHKKAEKAANEKIKAD